MEQPAGCDASKVALDLNPILGGVARSAGVGALQQQDMLRNECPGAGQKRSVKEHHTKLIAKNSREAERRNVLREAEDPEFRRNNRPTALSSPSEM